MTRSPSGRRLPVADGPFPWSNQALRLMSGTAEEFTRALKLAFGDNVSEDNAGLRLSQNKTTLHFAFRNEVPQSIGALKISNVTVEISVLAGDSISAKELLARVDRATLRGGG